MFFYNLKMEKTFPTITQNAERQKSIILITLYKKKLVYGGVCVYYFAIYIIDKK